MNEPYRTKWHEKYFRSERIALLTDGVYAIVLTLLVLDIHIPTLKSEDSTEELWMETKKILPHLWSFFITFLWIANQWYSNQSFNRLIVKSDSVVIWLQLFMLMLTCLYPFPTALMGEYPHNPLAVIYFGVLVNAGGWLVVIFTKYTVRKNYISEHVDLKDLKKRINLIPKLMPLYLVPIIIAFYFPILAQIIYFGFAVSWVFQTSSWKLKEDENFSKRV